MVFVSMRRRGSLVAGLAEQALARAEHDREDDQPQLVDQVVLDQRAHERVAGVHDDLPVYLLLELRDLARPPRPAGRSRWSIWALRGSRTRRTWAGCSACPPLAAPGRPPCAEVLVAPPTQQQRLGALRLGELELGPRSQSWPLNCDEPAAVPEAFLAVRVLDDAVERDVLRLITIFPISVLLARLWCSSVEAFAAREIERRISGRADVITVMRVKGRVGARMRA